jgi:hypothetical protein
MKVHTKEIDFTAYDSPELQNEIIACISFEQSFRAMVKWATAGIILAIIVTPLVLNGASKSWLIACEAYALIAGLLGGLSFAIAETIRRSVGQMLRIAELLIDLCAKIVTDWEEVQDGKQTLPPTNQLVQKVYAQVVLPIVERVLSESLGVMGRPMLLLYRHTLGRVIRYVIIHHVSANAVLRVPGAEFIGEKMNAEKLTQKLADNAAKAPGNIELLKLAQDAIQHLGGKVKAYVMRPCYILFGIILSVLFLPVLLVKVLAT